VKRERTECNFEGSHADGNLIVAGNEAGRVHILSLELSLA
jgi:hypothetical protein